MLFLHFDRSTPRFQQPELHLRQSLQRQYISSGASENDLFSKVQRKLANRKSPEVSAVVVSNFVLQTFAIAVL